MLDYANSKCRITGEVCTAWSEIAGCGLVRCKFEKKEDPEWMQRMLRTFMGEGHESVCMR